MPVCLVLGAGATLANALHFRGQRMQDTRPPLDMTFFRTVSARRIALSRPLRRYFEEVMGIDVSQATALGDLRMEEVFKDVFFDFVDDPHDALAVDAYIDLVELYLRVLRETTNWLNDDGRLGAPVGRLIAAAADADDRVDVITFNHDLVIENEIHRRARLSQRWCIDRGYGSLSDTMVLALPPGGVPQFHLHTEGLCNHDRLINVLKLHGSLNWVVRIQSARPTANFLAGRNQPRDIHVLTRRQIRVEQALTGTGQGRNRWVAWPVVVPPVYAKQALRAAIHLVWDDARAALAGLTRRIPMRWYPSLESFRLTGGFG